MQAAEFKRIVSCFVDTPSSLDLSKGEFAVQLRDEVLTARLERQGGSLHVVENGVSSLAEAWISERVARLPLLASRIEEHILHVPNFVNPSAHFLRNLNDDPSATTHASGNVIGATRTMLEQDLPGTTSVIYLTSDAGEGKTTIITTLARQIASEFRKKATDWLLLPIPLGGRAFLRFDELVVSTLVSRLRFPYWYYEGFIELVRMGLVVPAFDGFEEMIVEGSSGEAVSALGNLMNLLNSEGTVLFAARKAFFEYQSFRTQARLFDAIGREDSVAFSRITIERWTKAQFLEYGRLRKHADGGAIYDRVAAKFGQDHPLLTRAVLVRRLFDVASNLQQAHDLLAHLGQRPQDYFHEFVMAIVDREAGEKWLDKEGREGQSLLTSDQHLDLLAAVAREMWISSTDALRQDVVDVVADLYCEEQKKSPALSRQIRERLKHHALLVTNGSIKGSLSFDHEDFKSFFTGVALGKLLLKGDKEEIRTFLRVASIPADTADEALLLYKREKGKGDELLSQLTSIAGSELSTSFVVENVGSLVMRLLDGESFTTLIVISGLTFAAQSLRVRSLNKVLFQKCYFAPTGLYMTRLSGVVFESCQFERLELSPENVLSAELINCEVACVVPATADVTIFDPSAVASLLTQCGLIVGDSIKTVQTLDLLPEDERLMVAEKAIRVFLRSTQVNEDTFRVRLGNRSSMFFSDVLPPLERLNILEQVAYRGAGNQTRYRLTIPMTVVQDSISKAKGSFDAFLSNVRGMSG